MKNDDFEELMRLPKEILNDNFEILRRNLYKKMKDFIDLYWNWSVFWKNSVNYTILGRIDGVTLD